MLSIQETKRCVSVQRNEAKLSEDAHRLRQEKQALEVELQLVKKERDLAKAQAVSASGKTGFKILIKCVKKWTHLNWQDINVYSYNLNYCFSFVCVI